MHQNIIKRFNQHSIMVMETAEAVERLEEPLAPLAQQSGQVYVVEAVEHWTHVQCILLSLALINLLVSLNHATGERRAKKIT